MSDQPKISDPDYQDKDIDLKALTICIVGIAVVIVASFLAMKSLYQAFEKKHGESSRPGMLVGDRVLPPQPRLQVNEPKDLAAYMEQAQAVLHAPRSVNAATGTARVPISEAKEIVLQRGVGPLLRPEGN